MLPFIVTNIFGIAIEYIISAVLVAAGLYLYAIFNLSSANPFAWIIGPLRYGGLALCGIGIALACVTYGKAIGAADCEAAWKRQNLAAQIASLKRDVAAAQTAAQAKADEAKVLAEQKASDDAKILSYENHVFSLSASLISCRRASDDDDRRVCDILGNCATGHKPAH